MDEYEIWKSLQPKPEIKLLTCLSVMKDFCRLITDLQRGKTCFSDNDEPNKIIKIIIIIKINKIFEISKISKIIKMIKTSLGWNVPSSV